MAITFRTNSVQWEETGVGDVTGNCYWLGPIQEGDLIVLTMAGTFSAGGDDSMTVTSSGFTALGSYTIPSASASGASGMKIACFAKIATAGDISGGTDFTFGSGFNTSLLERGAGMCAYSGTDDIYILSGPVANGFAAGGGTSLQFPNPGTEGVPATVFSAGVLFASQNQFPVSRGSFTRRFFYSPGSVSMSFLDAYSTDGSAVTMPVGTTTTQAMGALSFAFTDAPVDTSSLPIRIVDDHTTMYYENPPVAPTDPLLPDMSDWGSLGVTDLESWDSIEFGGTTGTLPSWETGGGNVDTDWGGGDTDPTSGTLALGNTLNIGRLGVFTVWGSYLTSGGGGVSITGPSLMVSESLACSDGYTHFVAMYAKKITTSDHTNGWDWELTGSGWTDDDARARVSVNTFSPFFNTDPVMTVVATTSGSTAGTSVTPPDLEASYSDDALCVFAGMGDWDIGGDFTITSTTATSNDGRSVFSSGEPNAFEGKLNARIEPAGPNWGSSTAAHTAGDGDIVICGIAVLANPETESGGGRFATIRVPGNSTAFDHHLTEYEASDTAPVRIRASCDRIWEAADSGTGTWFNHTYLWLEDLGGSVLSGTQQILVDPNFGQPDPSNFGFLTEIGTNKCAIKASTDRSVIDDASANLYVEWEIGAGYRGTDLRVGIGAAKAEPPVADGTNATIEIHAYPVHRYTEYARVELVGETECPAGTSLTPNTAGDETWTSFGDPSLSESPYFPDPTKYNRFPYFSNDSPFTNTDTAAPFSLPLISSGGQLGTKYWSTEIPEIADGQIYTVDMAWTPTGVTAHGSYRFPFLEVLAVDSTGNMVPIIELTNESALNSVYGPIHEYIASNGNVGWYHAGFSYTPWGDDQLDSHWPFHYRRSLAMTPQTWMGTVRWRAFGVWDTPSEAFQDNGVTRASSWAIQPATSPHGNPTHLLVGVMGAQYWTCDSFEWSVCSGDKILRWFPRDDNLGSNLNSRSKSVNSWAGGAHPTSFQRTQKDGRIGTHGYM